jgi:peroxiredoxin
MFVSLLKSKAVFACHCEIGSDSILIGILVVNEALEECELTDPDTKEKYQVFFPNIETPAYDVEIKRVRNRTL